MVGDYHHSRGGAVAEGSQAGGGEGEGRARRRGVERTFAGEGDEGVRAGGPKHDPAVTAVLADGIPRGEGEPHFKDIMC